MTVTRSPHFKHFEYRVTTPSASVSLWFDRNRSEPHSGLGHRGRTYSTMGSSSRWFVWVLIVQSVAHQSG
jgi:hypothetical protein